MSFFAQRLARGAMLGSWAGTLLVVFILLVTGSVVPWFTIFIYPLLLSTPWAIMVIPRWIRQAL